MNIMKRHLYKWVWFLAVALVSLGIAVPQTAFADNSLPMTIGTMGEDAHAVNVTLDGGEATIVVSVNGDQQEGLNVQAKEGDSISVSVAPITPTSAAVASFEVTTSPDGTAIERKYSEGRIDNTIYYSHVYTFTMPATDVAVSCTLGGVCKLSAYCASGWDDFDFTIENKSGDSMMPNEEKIASNVPCRIYYLAAGNYEYALNSKSTGKTIDSGELSLNQGSRKLNWNTLTVTVEPIVVEGLDTFGTGGCICTREDSVETEPIFSAEDESGLYTATFLLRGKVVDSKTKYTVSATPKDSRCSVVWVSDVYVDNVLLTGDNITVTSSLTAKYIASAKLRASDIMIAQGQAITALNGYDPKNYLDEQKAEVEQIISDAVAAIKAAESEEAITGLLDNAKQALDAIETAGQVVEKAAPVAQAIADLPAADALTLDGKEAVKSARAAYNDLTDAEKAYVGEANLLKLELAEAVIEKLALAEQVTALEGEKKDLEDQVTALTGDKEALQGKVDEAEGKLKAAEENLAKAEERAKKAEEELAKATAAKKANTMTASAKAKTLKAKTLKKKAQTFKAVTVKDAKGKVTYAKVKVNKKKFAKKFTVNKTTGKITVKKGVKKGTYKVTVKVSAAGDDAYEPASKNVVVKVTVK